MDNTEHEARASSSDEAPEGIPAPPNEYDDPSEYESLCNGIRDTVTTHIQRRNALCKIERTKTNIIDAAVMARLVFSAKVQLPAPDIYTLQCRSNEMNRTGGHT